MDCLLRHLRRANQDCVVLFAVISGKTENMDHVAKQGALLSPSGSDEMRNGIQRLEWSCSIEDTRILFRLGDNQSRHPKSACRSFIQSAFRRRPSTETVSGTIWIFDPQVT
jgi:hypothetical protein